MSHTCEAILVHCMDFRLREDIYDYLRQQGLTSVCDNVSVAGGAGALVNKESQGFILKQIALSQKLHGIKKVILMNHTDCGAYGGKAAFKSEAEEKAKHQEDLNKAEEIVKKEFPELEAWKIIANMSESGHVSSFDRL